MSSILERGLRRSKTWLMNLSKITPSSTCSWKGSGTLRPLSKRPWATLTKPLRESAAASDPTSLISEELQLFNHSLPYHRAKSASLDDSKKKGKLIQQMDSVIMRFTSRWGTQEMQRGKFSKPFKQEAIGKVSLACSMGTTFQRLPPWLREPLLPKLTLRRFSPRLPTWRRSEGEMMTHILMRLTDCGNSSQRRKLATRSLTSFSERESKSLSLGQFGRTSSSTEPSPSTNFMHLSIMGTTGMMNLKILEEVSLSLRKINMCQRNRSDLSPNGPEYLTPGKQLWRCSIPIVLTSLQTTASSSWSSSELFRVSLLSPLILMQTLAIGMAKEHTVWMTGTNSMCRSSPKCFLEGDRHGHMASAPLLPGILLGSELSKFARTGIWGGVLRRLAKVGGSMASAASVGISTKQKTSPPAPINSGQGDPLSTNSFPSPRAGLGRTKSLKHSRGGRFVPYSLDLPRFKRRFAWTESDFSLFSFR